MEILGEQIAVVGIPAGVKMHSGVFAINPKLAGTLAINFLLGQTITKSVEIVDYDDASNLKLYGYMRVPYDQALVQDTKSFTSVDENSEAIAAGIMEEISDDYAVHNRSWDYSKSSHEAHEPAVHASWCRCCQEQTTSDTRRE